MSKPQGALSVQRKSAEGIVASETSPVNRKAGRSHTGKGPNGGPSRMVGINERGSRRYVLMIITQQSSEMTIASYLTDPSTGGNRLMEIICERENIRRALNLELFLPGFHLLPDQPNRLST